MTLRIVLLMAVAGAAACASSSKTPEPSEPARSVSTASAAPDGESAPAGAAASGDAAALDPRLAELATLMERFVVALEVAHGDCDRTVDAIEEFAHGADGKALRRASADEELLALAKAQKDALTAAYPALESRFMAVIEACPDRQKIGDALDESGMFVKRRVDGTRVEDMDED